MGMGIVDERVLEDGCGKEMLEESAGSELVVLLLGVEPRRRG
jgi:hypothetical protein